MRCGSNSHTRPPVACCAQRRGGGPQVGLVRGRDDRAGRGQHERDRLRGRLPRPGRHERRPRCLPTTRTPPARGGRRGASAARAPARPAPGRIARGSVPARDRRSPAAARAAGSRVSARIRGLRASAATGSPGAGRQPADQPRAATTASAATPPTRITAAMTTATVGVCGHACWVRPCSRSPANFVPNGSVVPPVDRRGDRGRGPDQPGQRRPRPAADQHRPAGRASAGAAEARGPSARLTAAPGRSPIRGSAWSVSYSRAPGRPG